MNRTLHPHQSRGLTLLRQSLLAGHRRVIVQAPTGAGKTVLAASIIESALAKGNRVLLTVPAIELIQQTIDTLWAEGIHDIGVIQADHEMTDGTRAVQVASVQSLVRRRMPKVDLVLVDEAHRWFKQFGPWMADEAWRNVPFIGLSATPWTRGLGEHYSDLITVATVRELIDSGFLAPFRVFAPSHPDLSAVRTVAGDFHEGELADAMSGPTLVADVVDTWQRLGEGRPTICFAVNVAHGMLLCDQFTAAGVPAAFVSADTPREERAEVRRMFASGDLAVVVNVGVLTTGVDWDVRCIILARPTKSEMLFCQMIGRGLRTAAGKADCLILDHADNHLRLGFVTDIHHGRLHNGKAGDDKLVAHRAPEPTECGNCATLRPRNVRKCPTCGAEPERLIGTQSVAVENGELIEFDRRAQRVSREQKAAFFGEIKRLARMRGKSEGWAAHQFRDKFKVWPNGFKHVAEREPTPATLAFVKSRQIAFAKSRRRLGGAA